MTAADVFAAIGFGALLLLAGIGVLAVVGWFVSWKEARSWRWPR